MPFDAFPHRARDLYWSRPNKMEFSDHIRAENGFFHP